MKKLPVGIVLFLLSLALTRHLYRANRSNGTALRDVPSSMSAADSNDTDPIFDGNNPNGTTIKDQLQQTNSAAAQSDAQPIPVTTTNKNGLQSIEIPPPDVQVETFGLKSRVLSSPSDMPFSLQSGWRTNIVAGDPLGTGLIFEYNHRDDIPYDFKLILTSKDSQGTYQFHVKNDNLCQIQVDERPFKPGEPIRLQIQCHDSGTARGVATVEISLTDPDPTLGLPDPQRKGFMLLPMQGGKTASDGSVTLNLPVTATGGMYAVGALLFSANSNANGVCALFQSGPAIPSKTKTISIKKISPLGIITVDAKGNTVKTEFLKPGDDNQPDVPFISEIQCAPKKQ